MDTASEETMRRVVREEIHRAAYRNRWRLYLVGAALIALVGAVRAGTPGWGVGENLLCGGGVAVLVGMAAWARRTSDRRRPCRPCR
jgi:hypothetical protein